MLYCVALRFGACRLNAVPPLDSCTYLAVDNGATPVAFDLYSDLLLVLGTEPPTALSPPLAPVSMTAGGRHVGGGDLLRSGGEREAGLPGPAHSRGLPFLPRAAPTRGTSPPQ